MPKSTNTGSSTPAKANEQKGKKQCTQCHAQKKVTDFYYSNSPRYSLDQRVPMCKDCCKTSALNKDGTINFEDLKDLLRNIDKPLYFDLLYTSEKSVKKENSYLSDEEVTFHGLEILQKYFTFVAARQDKCKSYSDAEREGFIHQNSNRSKEEKEEILAKYKDYLTSQRTGIAKILPSFTNENTQLDSQNEPLVYSEKWRGKYTSSDIKSLDAYYAGLERDYKIITENHRDYARKIAKASLRMDQTYDDMLNGVEGADKKYENATKAFDTLSKSAKFSESTRSVNDVGISSFSKVAAMVEAHNWIPTHKPLEKDTIDEMIDYLSTITKSL